MLYVTPLVDRGQIKNPTSAYNPNKKVRERLAQMRDEYQVAQTIMDTPYEEFGFNENGAMYNLVGRLNYNQKKFNLFRPPRSVDPDLSWHSNALKPIIRNKVISIVAHVTSQVLYPDVIAQNDDSTEDKDMASVMKDAVIWACEQSKYEDIFVDAVQEMCVNPMIILFQDYAEVKRKIKEKVNGKISLKEIVDEIYSGFITAIVSPDELYIGNVYEPNIQKQPFLIRRKIIDYVVAERKYGNHPDFKHVQKGRTVFFDKGTETFYEDSDEQLEERLVEEVTYYNRYADLELTVVGGILMSDPDEPMRRQDKMYPFATSVYETYNARFFYGMALVQKLEPDEDNLTALHRMFVDGTYLQMMPPISIYGETNVTAADFAPRSINTFNSPDTRVEPLNLNQNLNAGYNAIQYTEQSMADSSKQDYAPKSDTTAREIAYMEEQTKLSLGRTGKMVAKLVRDYGQLLVNSIVQYLPIAKVGEVVGDDTALKFPALFLADQDEEGKNVSKKIEFTTDMPEADTQEELDAIEESESLKALEVREKTGMSISKVDPEAFRNLKYTVKIKASFISESTKFAKAMMLFDRLAGDPDINQKKLKKDTILKELKPGHEQDYIADEEPVVDEVSKIKPAKSQPPVINNAAFTA